MVDRFDRAAGLEISPVPDGYVIYQSERDRVHFLNSTAAAIFELCDGEHALAEIAEILQAFFELDAAPEADLRSSVESLLAEGLIKPCAG